MRTSAHDIRRVHVRCAEMQARHSPIDVKISCLDLVMSVDHTKISYAAEGKSLIRTAQVEVPSGILITYRKDIVRQPIRQDVFFEQGEDIAHRPGARSGMR